jgi:hypothetical protein
MTEQPTIAAIDSDLNRTLLHALQARTSGLFRNQVAETIAQAVRETVGRWVECPPLPDFSTANVLKTEGYVKLGAVLNEPQVQEIVRYFESRPCFNGHVTAASDKIPRRIGAGAEDFHYGSYDLRDVLKAPYLLELANQNDILGTAEQYLGCTPTLYSLHAWWTFPGHGKASFSQEFHRDRDDFKFCTLFIYLTDVGPDTGPHAYIRRTHRVELVHAMLKEAAPHLKAAGMSLSLTDLYKNEEGYGWDDLYARVFPEPDIIDGPAGTAFMADTSGLHKGVPATEGRRLMVWARYGLYRNPVARKPQERGLIGKRIVADWRTAYVNRCLVRAE